MEIDLDFSSGKKRRRRRTKRNIILEILIWLVEIAAVILIAFLLVHFGVEKTYMDGISMSPVLSDGSSVIINKTSYWILKPKRYDVIVFKQSGTEHDYYDIKRIIGLPGEKIQITDGKIFIDGELCEEPIITESIKIAGLAQEEILLDEDEYFVLGDNRNYSEDSRYANVGNVMKSDIVGKALIRVSPFAFISTLNKKDSE